MSSQKFPITAAQLSGNFCETLFFGIYLVSFCFCARTLLFRGSGNDERWVHLHEIRWLMAGIALVLFGLLTFNVSLGLLHNFHAFVDSPDPLKEFLNLSDWINIARSASLVAAMILGDFVLIYRCWIVYGRRWMVIVPSLFLYLGGTATGIMFVEVGANPSTVRTSALSASAALNWGLAFFAITAFQNTLTTSILIWRIWRVEKESEKYFTGGSAVHRPRYLRKVIRVIAESGAAYTIMVLITFFVGLSKSNGLYPTSDMTMQVAGIAYNVIIIRSSARRDQQFTNFDLHERTTAFEQRGTDSRTLGSMGFVPGRSGTAGDMELTVRTIESAKKSSQSDIYPGGVTVSKSVMKS